MRGVYTISCNCNSAGVLHNITRNESFNWERFLLTVVSWCSVIVHDLEIYNIKNVGKYFRIWGAINQLFLEVCNVELGQASSARYETGPGLLIN